MNPSKIVLVTGATDGLGLGVALDLAKRGHTVIVHGRDAARIARAVERVREAGGGREVRSYKADFSSLAEVRAMAREVIEREERLDVLLNNAGIGTDIPGGNIRQTSRDGLELRFAVNYLAPFLLTQLLLPLLERSAPSRIVNVSSIGQAAVDFADPMLERGYSGVRAYCQSKLAQVLFTFDLADKLDPSHVTVTALHPATYMPTKIVPSPTSTLKEGVDATVRLAVDPSLEGVTGRFYDVQREARPQAQAYDTGARRKLRELSEKLVGSAGFSRE
jgi:NAD(P)-dependent dehydrogenase (short-subunit alcohol dehydrogenase family)